MGIIILVLISSVAVYYIWFQKQQMQEMSEMFALEKEMLFKEYEEVSFEFEGMKFSVNNDSIFSMLITEQEKVQRLQEELKTVKVTNARRISELKQELETLRKIMRNYVIQIDSLNSENEKLKIENKEVTNKYQQASNQARRLTQEVNQLGEKVQMAKRLDAANIQLKAINDRGRDAKIDKATKLMLTFIIQKNISANVGEQTLYIRLMKPDNDILTKPNSGTFKFENKDITYSLRKPIEYDGEEQSIILYWDIAEYISPGSYRVDIFAEGNLIGRKTIIL